MRVLEKINPAIALGSEKHFLEKRQTEPIFPDPIFDKPDYEVRIYDGVLVAHESIERPGVTVGSLTEGLQRYEPLLRKHIESVEINGSAQAFAALNTATLNQGLVIHIDQQADAVVTDPGFPGPRSRPAPRSPGNIRPAFCAAKVPWASSTRWR